MRNIELKKQPLFQSTLGDLVEVLKEELGFASESGNDEKGNTFPSGSKHYVRGMKELAVALHCSISTAQRIKSSGVIDAAISQNGKVVVIDVERALDILRVSNKKWGRKYSQVINRNRQFRWEIRRLFSTVELSVHKSRKNL